MVQIVGIMFPADLTACLPNVKAVGRMNVR